jgi:predicted RNase H-like nuclease (RuvC/YqgF family)
MNRIERSVKTILPRLIATFLPLLLIASGTLAQKSRTKGGTAPPQPQVTQQVTQKNVAELTEAASRSRAKLIETSKTYRESLERLYVLQKQEEEQIAALLEKNRGLFESGIMAKREVESVEQSLAVAQNKIAETQKQLESVDHLVAEVKAAEELAKMPAAGSFRTSDMLIRYVGSTRWAMSDLEKIDAFFRLKFGRVLPVSALGQTETHSRLGLDHHDAIDVAIHPDSAEGQELINYLRSQRISFIAIRGAILGSSTGAHIHIGPSSKRITLVN